MSSLELTFDRLAGELRHPQGLNPALSDPFFYFVHDPRQSLDVRAALPRWKAKLERDDWKVEIKSFIDLVWDLIERSGRWDEWLEVESDCDPEQLNEAIRDVLRGEDGLLGSLRELVAASSSKRLLLLTDAVCVHPYFRVRTLETGLHDQVHIPTVLFYPGRRSGQYGLHYLGFYPLDGNYRSTLIGGDV